MEIMHSSTKPSILYNYFFEEFLCFNKNNNNNKKHTKTSQSIIAAGGIGIYGAEASAATVFT